ncbi:hypothetical protein D7X55_23360 [Corallococcus sp. AB049A]|uniref:hypothetical protein n=1 Tax=Corallococcus sp. AB049A TaxID=2316721 RepID=UPI000EF0F2BE|nr:hypothetical protein [Corallococcus sp. AB049A]RKI61239.1 hypothetical protein D7X55_23360 [Corallococcus sp. AB049A]
MRRDTWVGLGIAGLACLLMCAGAQSDDAASEETTAPAAPPAQQQTPAQPPGTGGSGANTQGTEGNAPSSDPNSPSADPNPEGRTTPPNPGPDANAGTGGTGGTGTGAPAAAKPPAPGASQGASPGVAVVDAIYRGTVESVSPKEVVIDNEGLRLPLEIGTQTRIVREGEDISATELKEGERVRATVNIVGPSHTREIAVLTGAEARRDAENRRRR